MIGWGYACVGVLIALGYIAVGATVVRAAKPASGYMLIAVGALELLMRLCVTAVRMAEPSGDARELTQVLLPLMSTGETMLIGVLVAVAAVQLAKAVPPAGPSA